MTQEARDLLRAQVAIGSTQAFQELRDRYGITHAQLRARGVESSITGALRLNSVADIERAKAALEALL